MKKAILLSMFLLLVPAVLADYGMMGDWGMMGGAGWFGMGILGLLYFMIGALVFSVIFWLTHNWLVKPHKKK
ncbi:hypothetical protein HQ545_00880 [Candidatus Woesearchaeota archaeon]|nr:hypothetical protein [Candidatus Woesearchaeota archaeon]